jgi:hypothetical protein
LFHVADPERGDAGTVKIYRNASEIVELPVFVVDRREDRNIKSTNDDGWR